jgi:predicted outer membrane protein
MTLTHRLALTAMFAGAAAFAQSGTGTTGSSTYDPTRSGSSASSPPSASGSAHAQTGKTTTAKMSPSAVVSVLHQVNQDEIKLGRAAQSKAQNDKVKGYAKDMVDDHTALDKTLTDFVQIEGKGKVTMSSSQIPASKRQELKTMAADSSGSWARPRARPSTASTCRPCSRRTTRCSRISRPRCPRSREGQGP